MIIPLETTTENRITDIFWGFCAQNPIPFCLVDNNGKIMGYNNSMCNLTGYSANEIPDMRSWISKLISNESCRKELRVILRDSKKKFVKIDRLKLYIKRKDTTSRVILLSTFDLGNLFESEHFWIMQGEDVTDSDMNNELLRRRTMDLFERIKELSCLFSIVVVGSIPSISLAEIFQRLVNIIPSAWQYPDITFAKISYAGNEYRSDNYMRSILAQSNDLIVFGKIVGIIEVGYTKEKPEKNYPSFLKEERQLLDSISIQVSKIIEHKNLENELHERLRMESLISRLYAKFTLAEEVNDAIIEVLGLIGNSRDACRAYLFLLSSDGKTMDNTHEWCREGISPQIDKLKGIGVDVIPWWMKELRKNRIIQISDVDKMPKEASAEKEILEGQDIQSLIVLPLLRQDTLLGFIGFDNTKKTGKWKPEDISLLKITAEAIAYNISKNIKKI